MAENKNVYILNLEAKDLWLSNHYIKQDGIGYNPRQRDGSLNYRRFDGSFSDSLDLTKLKKVYYSVYRRKNMITYFKRKRYSTAVINVNFNLSVKEFNQYWYHDPDGSKNKKGKQTALLYVRQGYDVNDVELTDGICMDGDKLVAVVTGKEFSPPPDEAVLGKYFVYENGSYQIKTNPTIVGLRELRDWIYGNGFQCDGKQYVRFKRSNGSSRLGKCLFIDKELYPQMYKWQCCGLKPKDATTFDLAGFEAYIGLTLSSIIDTVEIYPENILIIDDYESSFSDRLIVTRDENGWLKSGIEETTVTNTIWDGQSLMDTSLFENYEQYGMLLLRNRFFKSCCFNTNIQKWFEDNGITDVSQLNGFTLATNIDDIKLITTPSSIKYVKFGTLRQWLDRLDPTFGVVKHEKPTHYLGGNLVSTHYQLINTLEMNRDEVRELLKQTTDFIDLLSENPAVLRNHIKFKYTDEINRTVKTKNDVIYTLLGINDRFAETKLYEDFKFDLMKSIKSEARKGRILVHGNYSTLFGNPIEMLQYSIGRFDGKSQLGVGNIYCKAFDFNEELLGSRSPHVCASNIYLANNVYNAVIEKYFNLSKQIVVVNSIDEPLLDRLSGSDFDSDTCMLTDNPILIKAAKRNYKNFLVPFNKVGATKTIRTYSSEQLSDLDYKTSSNKIGEIINLAQILTTMFWHNIHSGQTFEQNEELYCDIITLDVLSNVEIDKAKREFTISSAKEIEKLRNKYLEKDEDGRRTIPKFLGYIAKTKGYYDPSRKDYKYHDSSMDYVEEIMSKLRFKRKGKYTKLADLMISTSVDDKSVNYRQRQLIFDKIDEAKQSVVRVINSEWLDYNAKKEIIGSIMEERDEFMSKLKVNSNTVKSLIATIEKKKYSRYRMGLFNMLFNPKNDNFYNALLKSRTHISEIAPDDSGDIEIFGYRYRTI